MTTQGIKRGGATLTKKCVRDGARMLLKSSGPKQHDVALGIRCMRDLMLAVIDGRRRHAKRKGGAAA